MLHTCAHTHSRLWGSSSGIISLKTQGIFRLSERSQRVFCIIDRAGLQCLSTRCESLLKSAKEKWVGKWCRSTNFSVVFVVVVFLVSYFLLPPNKIYNNTTKWGNSEEWKLQVLFSDCTMSAFCENSLTVFVRFLFYSGILICDTTWRKYCDSVCICFPSYNHCRLGCISILLKGLGVRSI